MITSISTLNMTREDWLTERKKGIGGSDAAGILGLSPWASPFSIWADKTGRLPEKEDNEAMRQGRDLEEYVASRWSEATGKKVRRDNHIIRNTDYPFALANIDRRVVGENAGLECKTTSIMNLKKYKNGEYPVNFYTQCMHYLAITGADRWYLGVLVQNQGFYEYTIERDEDEIAALMDAEGDFWKYVEADTPPPLDGGDATTEALSTIYAESNGTAIDLFGREEIAREYQEIKSSIAILKTRLTYLAQVLKQDMQEAETGVCGPYTVTWKNAVRTLISIESLRKKYPKIDLKNLMTAKKVRRFQVTEKEKEV